MRFIIVIILIIGAIWFFSGDENNPNSYSDTKGSFLQKKDCSALEPDNPYSSGSGHYAGFEWGENGNSCGGNSTSFIDGCEEYLRQEDIYNSCVSR